MVYHVQYWFVFTAAICLGGKGDDSALFLRSSVDYPHGIVEIIVFLKKDEPLSVISDELRCATLFLVTDWGLFFRWHCERYLFWRRFIIHPLLLFWKCLSLNYPFQSFVQQVWVRWRISSSWFYRMVSSLKFFPNLCASLWISFFMPSCNFWGCI